MNPKDLKKFRTDREWTQQRCAKEFGVNQAQISRWERGKQPIPAWADALVKCLSEK